MPDRILRNKRDVDGLATFLKEGKLPVTVTWQHGKHRSSEQNRLQWLWANEVSRQRGDTDPADVQAEWKLIHGVPILRADDTHFRELYDASVKPLTYEQKVQIMRMGFPVTSLMKVPQMVAFMDAVQAACLSHGFEITDPDPDLSKYQDRYRVAA